MAYEYDAHGRMTAMATTRDSGFDISSVTNSSFLPPNSSLDVTRWLYDQPTGLLTNKLYADNTGPAYAYTPSGRLATRAWARGVTTSYSYDAFGQPLSVEYSDATPPVSYAYDALGRLKVAQSFLPATGEILFSTTNVYDGIDLVAEIQNGTRVERPSDAFGRPAGIAVGSDYSVDYGYDAYGRFSSVQSAQSADTNLFTYSYLPGSHLLHGYTATKPVSRFEFQVSKTYEPRRDLIASVSNTWDGTLVSAFAYSSDEAGRRTRRIDATPGLSVTNAFGYNPRSEVTEAAMGENTYGYAYDPIGNRQWSAVNTVTNTYAANGLNQYSQISAPSVVNPIHDADGNMLTYNGWTFAWSGENRLIQASNALHLVTYAYDHQGRMIQKVVDGQTSTLIWDGFNIIQVLTHSQTHTLTNSFIWGLDLSQSLQGAGGVGGLLAEIKEGVPYFSCFDANGNVCEYVATNGTLAAHYAYSAFGETASQSGDLADTFTHRFSTKPWCGITGLNEYELRKYSPEVGIWLSRDPIGERGGLLVHGFVGNNGVDYWDSLGLETACCDGKEYDSETQCCKNKEILSKEKKKTGIKKCCGYDNPKPFMTVNNGTYGAYVSSDLYMVSHCWVEYPGGTRGFYPDTEKGDPPGQKYRKWLFQPYYQYGKVKNEEDYPNYPELGPDERRGSKEFWKECEELEVSECDYDVDAIVDCMNKAKAYEIYNAPWTDCRHWANNTYKDCVHNGKR